MDGCPTLAAALKLPLERPTSAAYGIDEGSLGPPLLPDRRRRVAPFAFAGLVSAALLLAPPTPVHPSELTAAGLLAAVIVGLSWLAPWHRLPGFLRAVLPLAFLPVIALARDALGGSPSGVGALVMLPVVWLALHGTFRALLTSFVGVALVFVVPLVLLGGPEYPGSEWRRAVVNVLIAVIVGLAVQRLVDATRRNGDGLRRQRDFTSAILDTTGALVLVLDRDGRIERFNLACERSLGYREAEVLGHRP